MTWKSFWFWLTHRCSKFEWEFGFGFMGEGRFGQYEAEVCTECHKYTGRSRKEKYVKFQ
jgi:hypothetical protein